jgi:hypothetical protein
MTSLPIMAVIWFIGLLILFVLSPILSEWLWLGYLPIYFGAPILGVAIGAASLRRFRRSPRPAKLALLIAACGITLFFLGGFSLGRIVLFQFRKPHYEHLLQKAQSGTLISQSDGVIDPGPPPRFAFYWDRGVIDNWVGCVYDPTDLLREATTGFGPSNLHDPNMAHIVRLFGGDLYRCQHLQGHWYLCWFT